MLFDEFYTSNCLLDNNIWNILIVGPQEMDYWYLLGTCPFECSLPSLCKCQQRWGCSYMGCFFKEMYCTLWPHTCSNMCKMGWRWCDLYGVFLIPSFQFLKIFLSEFFSSLDFLCCMNWDITTVVLLLNQVFI